MPRVSFSKVLESPADGHYFFGYFNLPQVSRDETKVLALGVDFITRLPKGDDEARVGYFDLSDPDQQFVELGTTNAFNWQQGCMFQFCGPDLGAKAIFNRFDGSQYVSDIFHFESRQWQRCNSPIYAMFPCGNLALTIDFTRHYWCRRGYSYGNIVDESKNRPIVEGDGIWLININSGDVEQIVAVEDMIAMDPVSSMQGATHYLEHMTVSPSGSQFAFLHRWRIADGGVHSRLCLSDMFGRNIRVLNDSGRMSHYCWRSEKVLVGYGGVPNTINKMRTKKMLIGGFFRKALPLYHRLVRDGSPLSLFVTGDGYLQIDTETGRIETIARALAGEDGHPTMVPGHDGFVTDTYSRATLGQRAKLYRYDLASSSHELLVELGSIDALDDSPLRCDLHPRMSPSGHLVSIDTMDRGVRGVYVYRLCGET